MKEPVNLIIAGVGGQGSVLASQVIGKAAVKAGYRVSLGEVFGAAQRGGSVASHLRASRSKRHGPLVPKGHLDYLLGFEPLEAVRILLEYGNRNTVAIINTHPNYPLSVVVGDADYPQLDSVYSTIESRTSSMSVVTATKLAAEAGSPLSTNMVMTGALFGYGYLNISRDTVEDVLGLIFPEEKHDINLQALRLGFDSISK